MKISTHQSVIKHGKLATKNMERTDPNAQFSKRDFTKESEGNKPHEICQRIKKKVKKYKFCQNIA